MIPTPGYAYFIKDDFFELFGSPQASKLCCNKGTGHMRPYYCCKKERNSDLFWMIPMTTRYDKYLSRNVDQKNNYGKCITIALAKFAGRNAAILIQNAIPVHPEYITGPFTRNGNPVPLHTTVQRVVFSNLQRSLSIHRRGGCVFFPDIDYIQDIQITLAERDFKLPLDMKISSAKVRVSPAPSIGGKGPVLAKALHTGSPPEED